MKMKVTGNPEKVNHKRLLRKEFRKRVWFFFKLLLLAGLLYVNFEFQDWFKDEQEEDNAWAGILRAALFYLTTHLLVSLARILTVFVYLRRKNLREKQEDNVVLAINRVATLVSVAAFVGAAFLLFNISWQTFFTSFSLVAVATVILTKDYISNTVNGMIFMVTDRFMLGEYVRIGNHEGKVINITLSSVHLRTDEGDFVAIPNNTVYAADIVNYSRRESGLVSIDFDVKPDLLKDTARLADALTSAAQEYDEKITKNSYELMVRNISTDKVRISFQFRLLKPDPEKEREIRGYMLRKVSQVVAELSS
jgi:small-conductance mechanosensitive channel